MAKTKLLVVDDEPLVRQVLVDQFTEAGFLVEEAPNGEAALALLAGCPDFDLLLVDFMMPGIKGDEIAQQAKEICPDLRVAFLTGYGQLLSVIGRAGEVPVLEKSGRARDLVPVLQKLLAESSGLDTALSA